MNILAHSFSSDEDEDIPSFELLSFLYITRTREEYCGTTYSYLCVLVCMYDVPYYLFTFKPCTHAWYPVAGRRYCTFTLRDDVDTTLIGTSFLPVYNYNSSSQTTMHTKAIQACVLQFTMIGHDPQLNNVDRVA